MKDTEHKILDILSRDIGNPISIHKIKEKINDIYGHAHYPMIYNTIQQMEKNKLINIDKYGKSSVASLNFSNPLLIDNLAQVELINKIEFLEERKDWQTLVLQINGYLNDVSAIKSVMIVKPNTNAKLNRLEMFILTRNIQDSETKEMKKTIEQLQRVHNIRIDHLLMDEETFENLLKSDDANSIKEIMADKITIFYPQSFWFTIKYILDKGTRIQVERNPVSLTKISESDIVFNLARFGYKEMGTKITQGTPIGIEYIITEMLLKKNNVRRIESIPIIIAKNEKKINYDLLVFLATKFKIKGILYRILKILDTLRPTKDVKNVIKDIKDTLIRKAVPAQHVIELNLKDIEKKMRLYNVIE